MVNETMVDDYNEKRIQELEAINAELLEALEALADVLNTGAAGAGPYGITVPINILRERIQQAREVIKKAKGTVLTGRPSLTTPGF